MRVFTSFILSCFLGPTLIAALHFESFSSLSTLSFNNEPTFIEVESEKDALDGSHSLQQLISSSTSSFVRKTLEEWGSTGLSLAVVQRDETSRNSEHPGWRIEYGSYGVASTHTARNSANNSIVSTTRKVTPDTLFAIASNSKLFLSISVGLLISNATLQEEFKRTRGVELSWNTKMRDVLGNLWKISDEDIERGATIQDLLGHRTGLPRHDFSGVQRKGGVEEMIRALRSLRPSATLRETFQYNNLMYETLSYLPTILLNQTYESYVAENLLAPLNMTSTTFSVERVDAHFSPRQADLSEHMAQGHLANQRDFGRNINGTLRSIVPYFTRPGEEKTWAGAGGVISSARDLSTWVAMLLNDGKHPFTNKTVVPKEVLDWVSFGRSVASGKPDFPEFSPMVYGAAIFSYTYRGTHVLEHGGNNPGFKSQVARFPAHNLGVISLSNDGEFGGFVLEATKWRIVDELIFNAKQGKTQRFVDWTSRYRKLWADYRKDKREKFEKAQTGRGKEPEPSAMLGQRKFAHLAYGNLVPCRVPSSARGRDTDDSQTQQPFSSYNGADENPHLNCTSFLELPSTRRILSSLPSSFHAASESGSTPSLYISPFKRTFATHMVLSHYSGSLYNMTVIWTNDEVRQDLGLSVNDNKDDQDRGAMLIGMDEIFTVEYELKEGGLAIRDGFWGKEGLDSREPDGWGKEGAEVWFEDTYSL